MSKKVKRNEFLTKVGEGGGHKTYCQKLKHSICMIYYSHKMSKLVYLNIVIQICFIWLSPHSSVTITKWEI